MLSVAYSEMRLRSIIRVQGWCCVQGKVCKAQRRRHTWDITETRRSAVGIEHCRLPDTHVDVIL